MTLGIVIWQKNKQKKKRYSRSTYWLFLELSIKSYGFPWEMELCRTVNHISHFSSADGAGMETDPSPLQMNKLHQMWKTERFACKPWKKLLHGSRVKIFFRNWTFFCRGGSYLYSSTIIQKLRFQHDDSNLANKYRKFDCNKVC